MIRGHIQMVLSREKSIVCPVKEFSGVGSSILSDVSVPDGFIFKTRSEIIVYVVSLLLKASVRF